MTIQLFITFITRCDIFGNFVDIEELSVGGSFVQIFTKKSIILAILK